MSLQSDITDQENKMISSQNEMKESFIGPRHKKLLQAYHKAMESSFNKCSIDQVRNVFPSVLHRKDMPFQPSLMISHEESQNIVSLAYEKAMNTFQEKMNIKWNEICDDLKILEKLDSLDCALSKKDPKDPVFQLISRRWDPEEIVRASTLPLKSLDIESMSDEIETLKRKNETIVEQIKQHLLLINERKAQCLSIENEWDQIFGQLATFDVGAMKSLIHKITLGKSVSYIPSLSRM